MNAVTDITCEKCGASNPVGAKFCSACRHPLQATASTPPQPPPPQPPQRPNAGLGAMMSGGGKTVTKQVSGDAQTLYQQILDRFHGMAEAELQYEAAPQQLMVKAPYKSFMHTGGIVILVDTTIQIAQIAPGTCQVSVTTKTDNSSTNKLWMTAIGIWLLVWFLWMFAMGILLFGAILSALSFWILQSTPGEQVTKDLFAALTRNGGTVTKATPSASAGTSLGTSTGARPSTPAPAPAPAAQQPAAAAAAAAEEDVFERIDKLAKLRDSGAISEADFESKKAELLSRV